MNAARTWKMTGLWTERDMLLMPTDGSPGILVSPDTFGGDVDLTRQAALAMMRALNEWESKR